MCTNISNPWVSWFEQHKTDLPINHMHRMFAKTDSEKCGGCAFFIAHKKHLIDGTTSISKCKKYPAIKNPLVENWNTESQACGLWEKKFIKSKRKAKAK